MTLEQRLIDALPLFKKYPSPISIATRMAQFVVESQAGTSELAINSNNCFGIKASPPWTGEVYEHHSPEVGGARVSKFRKYPSLEASIKDHASFFTSTPHRANTDYKQAIDATSYKEEAKALTGVYAGDPLYDKKLIEVIERYNLTQYNNKKESVEMAKLTLEQAFKKLGVKFSKQLLPLTKTFGRINRKEGIVVHQTGAPGRGQNAQAMANYQKTMSSPSNPEEKSWNYQTDDQQVIMSFEHNVATWQASDGNGPGNTAHISIESCINSDGNYAKSIENLAKTIAVIAYVEGFNIERQTKRHYDFARDKKWCPAQIMNGQAGFTYAKVKAMAQSYLNILNGATVPQKPKDTANPQGLQTSKVPAYTAPKLSFKRFKKGDKLTFRSPWNWYDDDKKEFLHSKKHDELAGKQFTVDEVKEIEPIGYSKIAYKSKDHNSWILEQDVIEARESWQAEEVDTDLKDEGKDFQKLKEGQFWIEDTLYQITKIK